MRTSPHVLSQVLRFISHGHLDTTRSLHLILAANYLGVRELVEKTRAGARLVEEEALGTVLLATPTLAATSTWAATSS